jgi:hypothetical protein
MYKLLIVILVGIIGVSNVADAFNTPSKNFKHLTANPREGDVGIDFCPLCINEAVEIINVVLNVILDEGILGTCGELCGIVANKTKSKFAGELCDIVCDGVGIDEFIRLIIVADLDPIWYCEIADLCPSKLQQIRFIKRTF